MLILSPRSSALDVVRSRWAPGAFVGVRIQPPPPPPPPMPFRTQFTLTCTSTLPYCPLVLSTAYPRAFHEGKGSTLLDLFTLVNVYTSWILYIFYYSIITVIIYATKSISGQVLITEAARVRENQRQFSSLLWTITRIKDLELQSRVLFFIVVHFNVSEIRKFCSER